MKKNTIPKSTIATNLLEAEHKARLDAESARNKLYRLQYVTSALAQALTPKEIAEIIVTLGAATLTASGGAVWFFNKEKKLQVAAYTGYEKKIVEIAEGLEKEVSTPTTDAIQRRKPVILRSLQERKQLYPHTVKLYGDPSSHKEGFIALPLIVGEKVLGAINFAFDTHKEFIPEELEFIYTLTQQCAQSLDRARLYEEEKEGRERIEEVEERERNLLKITQALSNSLTLADIEKVAVTTAMNVLGASSGALWLLSQNKKTLEPVMVKGVPEDVQKEMRSYPLINNIPTGHAILSKKAIFIESKKEHKKKYPQTEKISVSEAFVSLPLHVRKTVLGVLNFGFSTAKEFTPDEKDFLLNLAGQCALAIDRAFGYQKIQEYAKEIEKREIRFRFLIENSSDAIILMDKNFNALYRSPSSKRITGEDPSKRVGESVFNVVKKEDEEVVKKWLKKLIRQPEGKPMTVRFRRIITDGNEKWLEATGTNFLHNPAIGALVANYRDVTSNVEALESLRKSRDELDIIFQNVADGVVVRDKNGKVVYSNPAGYAMNRFHSLDAMVGLSYEEYCSQYVLFFDAKGNPISQKDMPTNRILRKKDKFVTLLVRAKIRSTQEEQWRIIKASPIYDENGDILYVVSVYSDVTEQKQRENLKDEFISTASHELKTPITSAKLYAGILQKRLEELHDEKAFSMLTKVDVQLTRLTHLINDLLDVSKIRTGKVEMRRDKISLESLVRESVDEMQFTTITHVLKLIGQTDAYVEGDRERLRQVLMNLISNAIKYSPKSNKVDIILSQDDNSVKVCVRDYGLGIKKENADKIFEPFYREHHDEGSRFPGLGLGLHIASEIIKRHNGNIWVESTYGKGSTFCVTLPKVSK